MWRSHNRQIRSPHWDWSVVPVAQVDCESLAVSLYHTPRTRSQSVNGAFGCVNGTGTGLPVTPDTIPDLTHLQRLSRGYGRGVPPFDQGCSLRESQFETLRIC